VEMWKSGLTQNAASRQGKTRTRVRGNQFRPHGWCQSVALQFWPPITYGSENLERIGPAGGGVEDLFRYAQRMSILGVYVKLAAARPTSSRSRNPSGARAYACTVQPAPSLPRRAT
jgi:hypothetical protein